MRRTAACIFGCAAGCFAGVPDIPPEQLACTGDAPLQGGLLQCPESHWCLGDQCTVRLGCTQPGAVNPGCDPTKTRCDIVSNDQVSAVTCRSGTHTSTSIPASLDGPCGCPDGTICAALRVPGAPEPEAFPLYAFPDGIVSAGGENTAARTCVRGCSAELDCPGGHTCRPAAVVSAEPVSARRTIGVCFPDRLRRGTLTSTSPEQVDPAGCLQENECLGNKICRAQLVVIPDHPFTPAGSAWGEQHVAIIPRCQDDPGLLKPAPGGCAGAPDTCESGVCHEGRCRDLCDPEDAQNCFLGDRCKEVEVRRARPSGVPAIDRVFVCTD